MNQREHRRVIFFSLWGSHFLFFTGLNALMFLLPTIAITNLNLASESIGMLYAATMLPFILLSIPAGHFIETIDPRKMQMMVLLMSLLLAIGLSVQVSIGSLNTILIFSISIVSGVILLVSRLCYFSIIRCLFIERDRLTANSRLVANEQIGQILGTALMGGALNSLSTVAAISASVISILLAFIFSLKMPRPILANSLKKKDSENTLLKNLYESLKIKQIKYLTIFFFSYNFFYGMLLGVYFFFAITDRSLSVLQVSIVAGISSLGNLFATPFIRRIFPESLSSKRAVRMAFLTTAIGAIFLFGVFIPSSHKNITVVFFTCAYFIFNLANNISAVLSVYVRQKLAPGHLALLLGFGTTINYSALALGGLAGGFAGKYAGAAGAMVTAILGMTLVGIAAYGLSGQLNFFGKKAS